MSHPVRWLDAGIFRDLEDSGTNAFRIAEGPGFWIERFASTALTSSRPGYDPRQLADSLLQWADSIPWSPQRIYHRQLVTGPGEKDIPVLLQGDTALSPRETAQENGLLFEVDFSASYSPGLFPDQRANRMFLRQRKPQRLLNTFAYTCAFSVVTASVGALTSSVDVSKSSLQRGRRNFELNHIAAEGHRFIAEDVPTYLRRLAKRGETFDAIILDPPTFGRGGSGKTFRFERDFGALLEAALAVSAPGAAILLSTNCSSWDANRLTATARAIISHTTRFEAVPPPADFSTSSPSATVWALL
jgi:23S rRNA (cytosine1962-C5)-methyltransferase